MEDIRIGLDVYCGQDRVGRVAKLVADASDSHITDIVVDRGLLHGAKIIPIGQLADVRAGEVELALDRRQFEEAAGFAGQRFRRPGDAWSAPPGYDPLDFLFDATIAYGGMGGYGTPAEPGPFPTGPADPLPDLLRPVVQEGTDVRSVDGEKVGEIASISFHPDDGRLASLVMRSGLLEHERTALPLEWVEDLTDEGLVLNVSADVVRARRG